MKSALGRICIALLYQYNIVHTPLINRQRLLTTCSQRVCLHRNDDTVEPMYYDVIHNLIPFSIIHGYLESNLARSRKRLLYKIKRHPPQYDIASRGSESGIVEKGVDCIQMPLVSIVLVKHAFSRPCTNHLYTASCHAETLPLQIVTALVKHSFPGMRKLQAPVI